MRLYEPEPSLPSGNGPPLEIKITGEINRAMANQVGARLAAAPAAGELRITLDSNGGDFAASFDIFVYLDRHRAAAKIARIRRAESGALLAALAGDRRIAESGASILLHCTAQVPSRSERWTANSLEETAADLRWLDREFANIISYRTGKSPEIFLREMQTEAPSSLEWCIENNIITEIGTSNGN